MAKSIVNILESTYKKVDIGKVVAGTSRMNTHKKELILGITMEFEGIIDGTL